jgi:hypothetical protein
MATLVTRGLSAAVAVGYLTLAYFYGSGPDVLNVGAALLLPMACIWFSEAMGGYGGTIRLQAITAPTPTVFVGAGGWLLLVGVPLILFFVTQATE